MPLLGVARWGHYHIIPKTHWLWDVIRQLRRQGILLDAFIIERQQRLHENSSLAPHKWPFELPQKRIEKRVSLKQKALQLP